MTRAELQIKHPSQRVDFEPAQYCRCKGTGESKQTGTMRLCGCTVLRETYPNKMNKELQTHLHRLAGVTT